MNFSEETGVMNVSDDEYRPMRMTETLLKWLLDYEKSLVVAIEDLPEIAVENVKKGIGVEPFIQCSDHQKRLMISYEVCQVYPYKITGTAYSRGRFFSNWGQAKTWEGAMKLVRELFKELADMAELPWGGTCEVRCMLLATHERWSSHSFVND